jgi:hypothetical protein
LLGHGPAPPPPASVDAAAWVRLDYEPPYQASVDKFVTGLSSISAEPIPYSWDIGVPVDRRIYGSDLEAPGWASWLTPLKEESTTHQSTGEETIPPQHELSVYERFSIERAWERWTDSYDIVRRDLKWETHVQQLVYVIPHGGGGTD